MTSTPNAVPTVDLAALEGDGAAARAARARLLDVARDPGSVLLAGHGVPTALADALLAAATGFFALPDERKALVENVRSPQFRGWTRVDGEVTAGRVDHREQLDIAAERAPLPDDGTLPAWSRLVGPNQWPQDVPELRELATRWYDLLGDVGRRLLRALVEALGQPRDALDGLFTDGGDSLLKVVHYPARLSPDADQGVGPHTDGGLLTFVWQQPGTEGLQTLVGADWVDVPVVPGTFAVNIGELLEVATDGVLRANVHQVVSPPAGGDRLSLCFFLNPSYAQRVPTFGYDGALRAQAVGPRGVAGNPFHATYGDNALKSRLRSHPDVAQRHHADLLVGAG